MQASSRSTIGSCDQEVSSSATASLSAEQFRFSGSGSEYFRIWIVNLLLTIATLGIYSAWAKVRKTRYLYENTTVAGASFDYHGNPLAILKGRVIAVVLLAVYQFAAPTSGALSLLLMAAIAGVLPWLLWKSLQFSRANSSYRGIRFGFGGSAAKAYTVFLLYPLATMLTAYLLMPLAHHRIKRFQHAESRFGTLPFRFESRVGPFYKLYLGVAAAALLAITLMGVVAFIGFTFLQSVGAAPGMGTAILSVIVIYAGFTVLFQAAATMVQNLALNGTSLGMHSFLSTMAWRPVAWITATNLLGVIATLGLYLPFATIRMARYRVESMTLLAVGDLDTMIAEESEQVSATGEGVADLFDLDISL